MEKFPPKLKCVSPEYQAQLDRLAEHLLRPQEIGQLLLFENVTVEITKLPEPPQAA